MNQSKFNVEMMTLSKVSFVCVFVFLTAIFSAASMPLILCC